MNKEVPELQIFRFTRGVFGVSSSTFATIKFHLERYLESNEEVVQKLLRSTYVDDDVTGADTEEATFDLYAQAKDMFRKGGFNLRKFLPNSQELQQRIDHAKSTQQVSLANNLQPTKRNLFSLVGKFYDPLGS